MEDLNDLEKEYLNSQIEAEIEAELCNKDITNHILQIQKEEALKLIDSCTESYSLHTVVLDAIGNKQTIYSGDYLLNSPVNRLEDFFKIDNYGSFWLKFYDENDKLSAKYQIVDEAGEPI